MNMKQKAFAIVVIVLMSIPAGVYFSFMFEGSFFKGYLIGFGMFSLIVVLLKVLDPIIDFYTSLGDT